MKIGTDSPTELYAKILNGYENKNTSKEFVDFLKEQQKSELILMKIKIKDFATAVLHLLGIETYSGNDTIVLSMINNA